jgi:hypothetical protein
MIQARALTARLMCQAVRLNHRSLMSAFLLVVNNSVV